MKDHHAPPRPRPERGLFSLSELTDAEVASLTARSVELFHDRRAHERPLEGSAVGVLFTKTSTRTRTAFTVGAIRLGGTPIAYGPHDLQLNTGESVHDTGRVLGSMLDLIAARTAAPVEEMKDLSRHGGIPVVNAMSAQEHPTQGLCDLATVMLARGDLSGVKVLYVGEGNNSAVALAHGLATVPGAHLWCATPRGYEVPERELRVAAERAAAVGAVVEQVDDPALAPPDVDFVYTTRWQTTGTSKPDPDWRETFRPFHVDDVLMRRFPQASFLHDLPAHRGDEVSGSVLDGPRSLAWTQAAMKLPSAMAVLEWAIGRTA
ncbi:ornithine carbamoyltransferase [Streptomyces kanasensis]|uniref:ornithine carbamoyltransferase n=1 Tax=Streptomyces kanasensis TaxID=936756 RepID=UPI0036FEA8DE